MICSFKKLSKEHLTVTRSKYINRNTLSRQSKDLWSFFNSELLVTEEIQCFRLREVLVVTVWSLVENLNSFERCLQGKIQKKKIITNENLKFVSKFLDNGEYLDGNTLSEADVLTYVKIKQANQEVKGFPKLAQWIKSTGTKVDPIVEELLKEYKQVKQEEPQKKQQQKQIKEKQPKEEQKKQQPAPKVQVSKVKDEFTPEYLQTFNSLKIKRTNHGQEIYPIENGKNVLITSALPYVNNVPHLGNIIGCVLSADVYARYCRLRGYNTLYVCGTDEYGTATEVKAIQEGCTPQQICDKYFAIHSDIYKWFDIDFDFFGRTSTPVHTKITQDIFLKLHPEFTTTHTKPQTYCTKCTIFLADRYVSGVCPHCNYDDARGDQCDACGKLLDPIELKNPKCAICKNSPEIRDTTHIFINLPTIQPTLEQWISKAYEEGKWSENSINVSKAWLKQGLRERCITRDLKWGTPVPLEEFKHKVFYVWFDAPIGYLSITGNFVKDWEKWWKNPQNVKLYQFMGKDNVPFHTVIFPSTLLGTKQNFTLLHRISTTEYLNYEDGKFSKSRGVGVFGDNIVSTGIPPEVIRYYLLINRPEKSDSIFTWSDFGNKNNSELLPNIGNLVNRTLKFVWKKYNQKVPDFSIDKNTPEDQLFISQFFQKFDQEFIVAIEATEIKDALKKAMELSSLVNKYLQDEKAWEKEQLESKRSDQILGIALCAIRLVSAAFEPFMPSMSAKINFLLGFTERTPKDDTLLQYVCESKDKVATLLSLIQPGQTLNQPVPLFRSYSEEELANWRSLYAGQQQKK